MFFKSNICLFFRRLNGVPILDQFLGQAWTHPWRGLGRPLKTCFFQTRPQNLQNQALQAENFNLAPISSNMVQVMMVYERSCKTSQKMYVSNYAPKPL